MNLAALVAAIVSFGAGYRTYIAAVGMLGLALYQASQKDYAAAFATFMQAMGLFGIRAAIDNFLKPLAPFLPTPAAPDAPKA